MRLISPERKRLLKSEICYRAKYRAPQRADAPEDCHHQEFARPLPGHEGRRDKLALVGEERSGDRCDRSGDHAGGELGREGSKAKRRSAQGILPDRIENAAEARARDPHQQQIGEGPTVGGRNCALAPFAAAGASDAASRTVCRARDCH